MNRSVAKAAAAREREIPAQAEHVRCLMLSAQIAELTARFPSSRAPTALFIAATASRINSNKQ